MYIYRMILRRREREREREREERRGEGREGGSTVGKYSYCLLRRLLLEYH